MRPERHSPDRISAYSQEEIQKDKGEKELAFEVDELINRIRYKIQRTLEENAEHSGRRSK
jgi:hypothetical protein